MKFFDLEIDAGLMSNRDVQYVIKKPDGSCDKTRPTYSNGSSWNECIIKDEKLHPKLGPFGV